MFCEHWKLCSHLLYLWRLKCSKITNISIKVGSTGGQTLWFRTYRHRVLKSAFWQVSRSLYTLKLKTHFLVSVLKCACVSICCSETERYGILLQFLGFNFSWKLLKFWLYGWVDIVGDQKSRAAIIHYFVLPVKPFVVKHLNLAQLSVGYGWPALHFLDYHSCFPMSLYFKYVSQRIHDFHFIWLCFLLT